MRMQTQTESIKYVKVSFSSGLYRSSYMDSLINCHINMRQKQSITQK